MYCNVYSAGISGISAELVSVEVDISGGLPAFNMVGSLAPEVREAKERVARALANSGIEIPSRKITVNISPADIRKKGTGYDLAIAVGILACMGLIDPIKIENMLFIGELSLDGSINSVRGVLSVAILAAEEGIETVVVPAENIYEGAAVSDTRVCGAFDICSLIEDLREGSLTAVENIDLASMLESAYKNVEFDFRDVMGQERAKRAALIAVCGFHNLLLIGPPGSGKSMIAKRLSYIEPVLSVEECIEISKIYSVSGKLDGKRPLLSRPFRAPHHSITPQALAGGSQYPIPGEITLAHKGILFLDEACEFRKETIEVLRQPMEDKQIVISRMKKQITFPSDFMLVMAANPCKCGYFPDRNLCRCSPVDVQRYIGRIKGPVLDRVDICAETHKVEVDFLSGRADTMSTGEMRQIVLETQNVQRKRFKDEKICFNSQMDKDEIDIYCRLDAACTDIMHKAYKQMNMSARAYYKVLKVARTIADMEGRADILKSDILEALSYRNNIPEA